MATQPSEETLARFAASGLITPQQQAFLPSADPASVPEDTRAALAADIGAALGALLVLVGTLALAFMHFEDDSTAQLVVLGVAGVVVLAVARASLELRPRAASNWLAGGGALLLGISFAPASALFGYAFDSFQEGWILGCILLMAVCGAVCWWLRSALAGSIAAAALVALPGALTLPATFELASWPFVFSQPVSALLFWGALSLMALVVLAVELVSLQMDRRGWADRDTSAGAVITSSTVLGIALVAAASTQGASWFYFLLIIGAVVATGISVRRRDRTWLSFSGRLFTASTLTTLLHINETSSMALALVLLALTLFPFIPLRNRLPGGFAVLRWEVTIWLCGFAIACAFAFEFGAWLIVEWAWALAMVLLGVARSRPIALVIGGLALFVVLMITIIEMVGATVGTGFGTLVFGATVLAAVIVWRHGYESIPGARRIMTAERSLLDLRAMPSRPNSLRVRRG